MVKNRVRECDALVSILAIWKRTKRKSVKSAKPQPPPALM